MKILFLNLASQNGFLACVSHERTVASKSIDHRIGDHELIPMFEKCLVEAGWTPKDLTHIACITGPGGFTSLRVAVAFANTLAWERKIPIAGIHLSDLCAVRASSFELRASSFLWLHSTKKTHLFIRGFGEFTEKWPEPTLVTLENLQSPISNLELCLWTGELISEHRAALVGLQEIPLCEIGAVLPVFLSKLHYEKKILKPWYGRGW